MALTKTDIVKAVQEANNITKKEAGDTVEILLEIIKGALASGEDVLVSGFGKFMVRQKGERMGRNPETGARMMISPRKVVTFKCSGKLRENVNER